LLPQPRSTLFPYTTLFRSSHAPGRIGIRVFNHYSFPSFSFSLDTNLSKSSAISCAREDSPRVNSRPAVKKCSLDSSGNAYTGARSEEHTSELQSLAYLVCR